MYHHLTRRHISALLSVVVRDRLALYLRGRHEPHDAATRGRARREYLVATGRAS